MTILVTSGATREPIDAVRYISNVSTGETGAALAKELLLRGHSVFLLRGYGSVEACQGVESEIFSSASDLQVRLRRLLSTGRFDAVVMTAAVADYRPEKAASGKIVSGPLSLTLRLARNPKILPELKTYSPVSLAVVGFKLTVGADGAARRAAVVAQWRTGGVDLIVHNDLEEIHSAAAHPFWIWTSPETEPEKAEGFEALADRLDGFFGGMQRRFA
jgi:phosphopantothenoylcysteine decarboxylase/phosphopantothenate--cysteine ligase